MPKLSFLRVHRAWEDWAVMAVGVAIALAPWVTKETANQEAVLNAAVTGFALMMLAELDLVHFRRWAVLGQLACGAWIAISALIFGYSGSGTLRIWHLSAGLIVLLLGALELWQHGQGGAKADQAEREAASRIEIGQPN